MGAFIVHRPPPLLILIPTLPRQADERAALNEIERLEDKAARNKPALPVPTVVRQFLSHHAARC